MGALLELFMITWDEFKSAICRYPKIANYDQSYEELMGDKNFIKALKENPGLKEVHKVIDFLNIWGCRIKSGDESEKVLLSVIKENLQLLTFLSKYKIEQIDFDYKLFENNFYIKIKDLIILIYLRFRHVEFKFGATATAKILHILVPELFVMWDKAILEYYHANDLKVSDSGPGYVHFLMAMKELAISINEQFQSNVNHPFTKDKDLSLYLLRETNSNHPKTLAKFLDEYNWVTITRNNA